MLFSICVTNLSVSGSCCLFNPSTNGVKFTLGLREKPLCSGQRTEKKLAKSGLNKLLDDVFISEKIGFDKPSINYYETVFEKVGSHNLEEYIMIGDSLTSDMQGGINAGITTCWFNPNKKENDKKLNIDYEINDLKEVIDILTK